METRTRFDNTIDLALLTPLLTELREKQEEFKELSSIPKPNPLDRIKSSIMTPLRNTIDTLINKFNSTPALTDAKEERAAVAELIKQLYDTIEYTLKQHRTTLNIPRNQYRQALDFVANTGIVTTATTIASIMSSGLIFKAFTLIGSYMLSNKIREATGLSDNRTRSVRILEDLSENLEKVLKILIPKLPNNKLVSQSKVDLIVVDENTNHNILNEFSETLQDYLQGLERKFKTNPNFATLVKNLSITQDELNQLKRRNLSFEAYKDPISLEIISTPVIVNGVVFDLKSVLDLKPDASGRRTNPVKNKYLFYLRDIQEAHSYIAEFEEFIQSVSEQLETLRNNKSVSFRS